ncbi:MAG: macro domain-containing protein [Clostridia bacterium]|nr:macro domain-containing protein [Clostridia bacterium]
MSFSIVKGDLFEQKVDAIVIPSQPSLALEGAVGGKAKARCGERLPLQLEQYKKIQFGQCVIADSFCDSFRHVILVANPKWQEGGNEVKACLRQSYTSCLKMAQRFELHSIAFPVLSAGAYGFPTSKAVECALEAILTWLKKNDLDVYLVVHDESVFKNNSFMLSTYEVIPGQLYKAKPLSNEEKERERFAWYGDGAEQLVAGADESKTFGEKIQALMAEHAITAYECYDGIVSKSAFNYYKSGKALPKRDTILALGVQMGLSIAEINGLLHFNGPLLTPGFPRDKAILDCLVTDGEGSLEYVNKELITRGFEPLTK